MPMFLMKVPLAAPHKCKSCGGVSKDWYIDTGSQEEFYGAVYYCNECFTHMANLAGFLSIEQSDKLQETLSNLTDNFNNLLDAYNELRERDPREIRLGHSEFNRISTDNLAQLRLLEGPKLSNEPVQSGTIVMDRRKKRSSDSSEDSEVGELSGSKSAKPPIKFRQ